MRSKKPRKALCSNARKDIFHSENKATLGVCVTGKTANEGDPGVFSGGG